MIVLFAFGCNKTLDVTPLDKTVVSDTLPDFNFISTSAYDFAYPDKDGVYKSLIELYVRPFEGVNRNSNLILSFTSNKYSSFIIDQDTLYSGDKIKVSYDQFLNYRKYGVYRTPYNGLHQLDFQISINNVIKKSHSTIEMK